MQFKVHDMRASILACDLDAPIPAIIGLAGPDQAFADLFCLGQELVLQGEFVKGHAVE